MEKRFQGIRQLPVVHTLKRLLKALSLLSGLAAFLVALAFLVFTYWLLPRLDSYRPALESYLSQMTGRRVAIAKLSGYWDGVAPLLEISGLSIANPGGGALTLEHVGAKPSWESLLVLSPRLSRVQLDGPSIELLRGRNNLLYLNGFPLNAGKSSDGRLSNLLLSQSRIEINNARLGWQDDYNGFPRINLDQGRLVLTRGWFGHTLLVSGRPTDNPGNSVELSVRWRGDDVRDWVHWSGSIQGRISGALAGTWRQYLASFGTLRTGEGRGSLDATFSGGRFDRITADFKLQNALYAAPTASSGTVAIPVFGGRLDIARHGERYDIDASDLTLSSSTGIAFEHSHIHGSWQGGASGGGELSLDNVDLLHLTPLVHGLGLDRNPLFARFAPSGRLQAVKVMWSGHLEAPTRYRVSTRFNQLAWKTFGAIPGVSGVSGSVDFDQAGGRLTLDMSKSQVRIDPVFPHPLDFASLNADIAWQVVPHGVSVDFRDVRFSDAALAGRLSGHYRYVGTGAGQIDLTASIERVDAIRVPDYMPYVVGRDTISWLRQALRGGELTQTTLKLSGDLDRFPFRGGRGGEFLVQGRVRGGKLAYQPGWPLLDGIDASLRFHNESMEIVGNSVSTVGVPLSGVKVTIPDLGAAKPQLQVLGQANGRMQDMLAFTRKSPVDGWLDGFTGSLHATGSGKLDLGLTIPLAGKDPVLVRGDIRFDDNGLRFARLPLPELEHVTGHLAFSEHGVSSPGLHFDAFGGAFVLKADSDAGGAMRFNLDGNADSGKVMQRYVPELAPYTVGRSPYSAHFTVNKGLESLQVTSPLSGTALTLPAPASKAAALAAPLVLNLQDAGRAGLRLDFSVGTLAAGRFHLAGNGDIQAGQVAIGRTLQESIPDGLSLRVAAPSIDLKPWIALPGTAPKGAPSQFRLDLETPLLTWGEIQLHDLTMALSHGAGGGAWHATLVAKEMGGDIDYFSNGAGLVRARMSRLAIDAGREPRRGLTRANSGLSRLPALDVQIADFSVHGARLGRLEMTARQQGEDDWVMAPVNLVNPDGRLSGSLTVRSVTTTPSVDSHFSIESGNVGKLLDRFGYRDTFYKGEGRVVSDLRWPGALPDFDVARVSGRIDLDLKNGRFARVDPGVARLLGVLSLQSLPRRIRLDFTDVFSEGFAFDELKGSAVVTSGVFASDNLAMKGPAADVSIKGSVNLGTDQEQLRVHVEPHIAESVALATGAALINPVIGVAALAAQKVLQDPFGKIFSVDYLVTGSLTEPVVKKLGATK
ncbi:YhdP family protein [Paludibacterium yongneupense]|uniref:YhdP family protein n=1 Tax=Paludibacterium yongneupense TaxID=400061 RepID=UPI001FE5EF3A|nr:YhdP family protein [Paludibacterium yongneupense]